MTVTTDPLRPPSSGRPRVMRRAAAALALTAALWAAGFLGYLAGLPGSAAGADPTDAIVVLTGGQGRVSTGIGLLDHGAAQRLFITGVHPDVRLADLVRANGIAWPRNCCIVLEHSAADTAGNAQETARWLRQHGLRSVRLVTSDWHMPRALVEFRAALPEARIVPHPVPDAVADGAPTGLLAREYTKLILAFLRALPASLGLVPAAPGDAEAPAGTG